MINDIVLEVINALLIAGIIVYQLAQKRYRRLYQKPGARLIMLGFCLMLVGACLDITDEFPQLNHFVVIGDTQVEAFLEKFFGYMLGSLLLLIGLSRILPVFVELEDNRQLIETIVETIPAPTFCKDEKGRYLACNQAFEKFIGLPRAQIVGQSVFSVAPEDLAETYQQADQALLDKGGRQTYEAQVQYADGTHKEVLFHKAVFTKEDGTPGGIVGVMLDISQQKQVEEGLRRLDRMKNEFISTAAHELRTPLTSVQGYSELLIAKDGNPVPFSEEQRHDFLQEIFSASESLAALVDDLLNVARIESGHALMVNIKPHQPETLLRKIVETFQFQHHQREITFSSTLPAESLVMLDERRFRQVVENLLSNAVKYSPDGSQIEIKTQLEADEFSLLIRDYGVGMTAEQLPRVFEKFYRAEPTKDQVGGLGIGMSIVKSIVDAHQGRVSIDSRLGEGTRVRVTLPLASA